MKQTFTITETISQAWDVMKSQLWVLVGLIIGYVIISFTIGLFSSFTSLMGIAVYLVNILVGCLFYLGYTRNVFQALDGEEPQFSAYGQESRKVFRFFLANILYSVIVFIGTLFLILPGIYLAIRLQFYLAYIVDEDCGIIDSLKRSWEITGDAIMPLLLLFLTMLGLLILGCILLGIGIFIAAPVCWIMYIIVYRKLNSPLNILEEAEDELEGI